MRRARRPVPKRKPAGEYHHGDLRQALIDAALQMLEESGAEGFTLREAARRVGVDHRAAYRHFADRDAVLAAVALDGYRALLAAIRDALAGEGTPDPRRRLLAVARTYVAYAVREPARYRVMTGPRLNEGGRFPELDLVLDEAFAGVKREIDALTRGDSDEATVVLWAALHGVASLVIMRRIRVRRDELAPFAERAIGYLLAGMATKA